MRDADAAGLARCARIERYARDLDEHDEFALAEPAARRGWRAFVRGAVAELRGAGFPLVGARLEIGGDLPRGAGLSSSAALEVALCLALLALGARASPRWRDDACERSSSRSCARAWRTTGWARTPACSTSSPRSTAPPELRCASTSRRCTSSRCRCDSDGWRLVVLDSGERHVTRAAPATTSAEPNARGPASCWASSRCARPARTAVERLPEPLRSRARHVLGENERVSQAVAALRADDLPAVGRLLNASHASLRDHYEVSTPAVEATVERLLAAGAAGARIVGGGFGGSVLGLFAPDAHPPAGAREVRPSAGAHLLEG